MGLSPVKVQALTLERLHHLLDPGRVYYRPVVFDILKRADTAELDALITGARELKAEYGDLDGIIKAAETAKRKAAGA
jgi:hypothetical protein